MTKLASTVAAAALACGAAALTQPAHAATLNGAGALRAATADVDVTDQVRCRGCYYGRIDGTLPFEDVLVDYLRGAA